MPRWTPEARRKQAQIQKTRQSWRHSTGPKTAAGKARSSLNAWKHGLRSAPTRRLRAALTRHSRLLNHINATIYLARRNPCPHGTLGGFIAKTQSRQEFGKNRREAPWKTPYGYPLPAALALCAKSFASLCLRDEFTKCGHRYPLYFFKGGAIKDACLPEQDKIRRKS